jgi:hypothetical protein
MTRHATDREMLRRRALMHAEEYGDRYAAIVYRTSERSIRRWRKLLKETGQCSRTGRA